MPTMQLNISQLNQRDTWNQPQPSVSNTTSSPASSGISNLKRSRDPATNDQILTGCQNSGSEAKKAKESNCSRKNFAEFCPYCKKYICDETEMRNHIAAEHIGREQPNLGASSSSNNLPTPSTSTFARFKQGLCICFVD